MAHKKDGLYASVITAYYTVHTETPAVYDGGILSHAKSTAILITFFPHSFMQ